MKEKFLYRGAVKDGFGNVLSSDWKAETFAESVALAKRNLTYQFKKKMGLAPNNRIVLCGRVTPC